MWAEGSEITKLQYSLKGLGLYEITDGEHCEEWKAKGWLWAALSPGCEEVVGQ